MIVKFDVYEDSMFVYCTINESSRPWKKISKRSGLETVKKVVDAWQRRCERINGLFADHRKRGG